MSYTITRLLPLNEQFLDRDVYLILLHANRIPPHLIVLVGGKVFTLTVKGATIDSDLAPLLRLIRKNNIETVFVRLNIPQLFTVEQLRAEIRKFILAYPRVEVGIATCLDPIKQFCGNVYDRSASQVNFIYELLPKLEALKVVQACYQLNMEPWLKSDAYEISPYSMNDIFEGIRKAEASGL